MRIYLALTVLAFFSLGPSAVAQPPADRPVSPTLYAAGAAAYFDRNSRWDLLSAPGFSLAEATAGRADIIDPALTAFTQAGGRWEISMQGDDATGGALRWPAGRAACEAAHREAGDTITSASAGLGFVRAGQTALCTTRAHRGAETLSRHQRWLILSETQAFRVSVVASVTGLDEVRRDEIAAKLETEMEYWTERWSAQARRPAVSP